MAIRFLYKSIIILTSLCLTFTFVTPSNALGDTETRSSIPDLTTFANLVENGQKDVLQGVYVKHLMALKVVRQPVGNDNFVSPIKGYLTEFRQATRQGNIGLLTHNYLGGQVFFQLSPGQEIQLIYGDKKIKTFVITDIQQYQALSPNSPTSNFINLDTKKQLSASSLFSKIYADGSGKLILQTCIFENQNPTWGRLFVIAEQIDKASAN